MAWTKDQQNAIDARNCNLLVSAAAGSGKTAVLIERIIKRVTDEKNPIDIDSIVVVTFTRAAAQEMKTRLGKAFENALSKNPGNRHLIKQISLLPEEIKMAARDYDPSRINRYVIELAARFHRFYNACRIKGEAENVVSARLKLADCTRQVIKNCLGIIGVSAPEKM